MAHAFFVALRQFALFKHVLYLALFKTFSLKLILHAHSHTNLTVLRSMNLKAAPAPPEKGKTKL